MRFRDRFLVVYPLFGLVGCALVLGLHNKARPDMVVWWLVAVSAVVAGTSIGWVASHEDPEETGPVNKPNFGPAITAAVIAVPGGIYLRQSVASETILLLFGLLTVALALGFALGALDRLKNLRRRR